MNYPIFINDVSSQSFGIVISEPVAFPGARPEMTTYNIAGYGPQMVPTGGFERGDVSISAFIPSSTRAREKLQDFQDFLMLHWPDFRLSIDPTGNEYRKATLKHLPEWDIRAGKAAAFKLDFSVDPRRLFKVFTYNGVTYPAAKSLLGSDKSIYNPLPYRVPFSISCTGSGTVTVGPYAVTAKTGRVPNIGYIMPGETLTAAYSGSFSALDILPGWYLL